MSEEYKWSQIKGRDILLPKSVNPSNELRAAHESRFLQYISIHQKIFLAGFLAFLSFMVMETMNHYYIDTGDYPRVVSGILNYHPPTQRSNFHPLEIKDQFSRFDYFNSYTVMPYGITWLTRFFSEIFNIKILAAVLKISYIIVLFKIYSFYFEEKNLLNLAVFIMKSLPLLSSANMGVFPLFIRNR